MTTETNLGEYTATVWFNGLITCFILYTMIILFIDGLIRGVLQTSEVVMSILAIFGLSYYWKKTIKIIIQHKPIFERDLLEK